MFLPLIFHNLLNPEDVVSDVLEAIKVAYKECSTVKVKLLKSTGGDKAQTTHYDLVQGLTTVNKVAAFHYSALISLQADTKLLIGEDRVEVDIPPFSMFFLWEICLTLGLGTNIRILGYLSLHLRYISQLQRMLI